jgi:hypothetical protein
MGGRRDVYKRIDRVRDRVRERMRDRVRVRVIGNRVRE